MTLRLRVYGEVKTERCAVFKFCIIIDVMYGNIIIMAVKR